MSFRMVADFKVAKNDIPEGLKKAEKVFKEETVRALKIVGVQLLNNVIMGSRNEPIRPPILTGMLRGSGSVFVGSEFIKDSKDQGNNGTPVNNYPASNPNQITIIFNTAYATRIHENYDSMKPGEASIRAGNVGGKFLEKHLKADAHDLYDFYAKLMRKYF